MLLRSISAGIVPEEIKVRLRREKLRKRRKAILYSGAGALVILAAVLILTLFPKRAEAIDSIAVLPLENLTGDAEQEYFVDGVTDELIDALPEERSLWAETYEWAKTDLLMLYGEMVQMIAEKTQVRLTSKETTRFARAHQVNPEAYEAYLKGEFHWYKFTEKGLETALKYYELALEIDPDFAPAYTGIAGIWGSRTYFGMLASEVMSKRMAAINKSLELDSMLPEGHYMLASNATWFEFDWEEAEREFQLTLELNPNYAQARVFYGLFLTGMGRFEEAKAQMRIGIELDPLNSMYQSYLGLAYLRGRQFDEAIAQFQKGLALQPDFADALGGLRGCYHHKGMYEEALAVSRRLYTATGEQDLLEALNRGHEEGGYREAMRQAAEALEARSNRAYAMDIATLYTYAGDKERALDWLEIAYQEKIQNLIYLNVYPKWDPLRDDPRFQDLLRKMNLPVGKSSISD